MQNIEFRELQYPNDNLRMRLGKLFQSMLKVMLHCCQSYLLSPCVLIGILFSLKDDKHSIWYCHIDAVKKNNFECWPASTQLCHLAIAMLKNGDIYIFTSYYVVDYQGMCSNSSLFPSIKILGIYFFITHLSKNKGGEDVRT